MTLKESIKNKSKTKITENINQQTSNLNNRNNLFFSEENYKSQSLNEQFSKFDKLFNHTVGIIMKNGKKAKAQKQLQNALIYIKQKINTDPYSVLFKAIKAVSPLMKLVFIKKGTKSIKMPVPLNEHQRHRKAIIWILEASNKQHSKNFSERLAQELIAVINGTSSIFQKKEQLHKLALINKANTQIRI
ncbi:hypothetical protein T552_03440 [Pneumocystis carinii B80]|uniref:Small ribosomal subunit protein uS7 domain-containing protein n=1 Tax=Pneumocystis carinii (strain B80) TaxID=1408658 RepID=A0A0W4ZAT4_PNEC8|nr:hypothetical protein T552_03440 [Pneumocystis carinii B80]KTW25579.1 hypothetical protein T552_03440 [Pneumocystis carinii B80]